MASRVPSPHGDPGLQPERTVLAWGRTLLSLVTASAFFLRWLPTYGPPILTLPVISGAAALAIYLTQRRRYQVRSHGLAGESIEADLPAVLWTAMAGVLLGGLGIVVVLVN